MSSDWQSMVKQAHLAFGQLVNDKPTMLDDKTYFLRMKLMEEELGELDDALRERNDVEAADAIGDLLYVVLGTAVSMGVDMDPIFREIHRSNMTKVGGGKRPDGKQLKPSWYERPDLKPILLQQGWDGH
jgi:predicted HAD superfamily Cof-like phosphohydrolase